MELTREQYDIIKPLMPLPRGTFGIDNLVALNALLFIAENGCKWRKLPERYGNWHSIYMKMSRWAKSGVLARVFNELKNYGFPAVDALNMMFLDSTTVKVHPHGVGALKKTESSQSGVRAED